MQNKPKAPKRFVFLITQLVNRYFSHDVGRDSAALTYYLLFAIFPLLIFVSTLLGVLRLDIESTSAFLLEFIPADVVERSAQLSCICLRKRQPPAHVV